MKTLRQAKIGESAKVVKLHGEGAVKRRIMDMGITKGVEVTIRKVAPLGDPIEITVRGYELSIRKADADMIEIESRRRHKTGFVSGILQRRSAAPSVYLHAYIRQSQLNKAPGQQPQFILVNS